MNRYKIYKCRIKLRKTFKGNELKPEVIESDGKELFLQVLWECNDNELYSGEYALGSPSNTPEELFDLAGITWIASGDVEIIE